MDDTFVEIIFEFFPVVMALCVTLFTWSSIRLIYRSAIRKSKRAWRLIILGSVIPLLFVFLQTQWWITVVSQNKIFGTLGLNTGWTIFNTLVVVFVFEAISFVRSVSMGTCQDIHCERSRLE